MTLWAGIMTWKSDRATLASLAARHVPATDPRVIEARRRMRAGRLAEHIAHALAELPPLTDEQRSELAALILHDRGAA